MAGVVNGHGLAVGARLGDAGDEQLGHVVLRVRRKRPRKVGAGPPRVGNPLFVAVAAKLWQRGREEGGVRQRKRRKMCYFLGV